LAVLALTAFFAAGADEAVERVFLVLLVFLLGLLMAWLCLVDVGWCAKECMTDGRSFVRKQHHRDPA